jgi:hypothetical protein
LARCFLKGETPCQPELRTAHPSERRGDPFLRWRIHWFRSGSAPSRRARGSPLLIGSAFLGSEPLTDGFNSVVDLLAQIYVRRSFPKCSVSLTCPHAHTALSRILRFSDISMKDIGGGIDIYRLAFARHHLLPCDTWDPWLSLADEYRTRIGTLRNLGRWVDSLLRRWSSVVRLQR